MKRWFKRNILWLVLMALAFIAGLAIDNITAEETKPSAAVIEIEPRTEPVFVPVAEQKKPEPEEKWEIFTVTAYCACEKCCGEWANNRPNGIVYTASGAIAEEGVTVAADWNVLPAGTEIEIQGIGTRVVQDTGSALVGNKIDLFFNDHNEAQKFGIQKILVQVID